MRGTCGARRLHNTVGWWARKGVCERTICLTAYLLLFLFSGGCMGPCPGVLPPPPGGSGRYIVALWPFSLRSVSDDGTVQEIAAVDHVCGVAIDRDGSYVITKQGAVGVSGVFRVSPGGTVTQICHLEGWGAAGVAVDANGNYVVADYSGRRIVRVSPDGTVVEVSSFLALGPFGISIDTSGNYVVTNIGDGKLYRVTPGGVATDLYAGAWFPIPTGIAVDHDGSYVVTEAEGWPPGHPHYLARITPPTANNSVFRTVIYEFPAGTFPTGVAVDHDGTYIVTEGGGLTGQGEDVPRVLSRVTRDGVRTVVCTFASGHIAPFFVAIP